VKRMEGEGGWAPHGLGQLAFPFFFFHSGPWLARPLLPAAALFFMSFLQKEMLGCDWGERERVREVRAEL